METIFSKECEKCGKHATNLICEECFEYMCIGCQSENNPDICKDCEENREEQK